MRAHVDNCCVWWRRAALLLALTLLCGLPSFCQDRRAREDIDSAYIERLVVSLVTCEPFHRIYSLYGHTGLRLYDPLTGRDLLANWGIFNMRQRFFALRFVFGLTDYSMDIEPWEAFCARYQYYGCGVYEQVLDLSWDEKLLLCQMVDDNYLPANRQYRYNYFYDNCTTRVRDLVERCTGDKISYAPSSGGLLTFRSLLHEWTDAHLWMQWGDDFLLGVGADRPVSAHASQFLPFTLSDAFATATVSDASGSRPLVVTSQWVLPPQYDKGTLTAWDRYVASPTGAAMLYALLFVVVVLIERRWKKNLWQVDVVMLAVTGVMGLLLLAMVFSQHPAVRVNGQLLIFNPLSLLLLRPICRSLRRGERSSALLVVSLLTGVALVVGMTLQRYAEGVMTLALFLLLTYLRHYTFRTNDPSSSPSLPSVAAGGGAAGTCADE